METLLIKKSTKNLKPEVLVRAPNRIISIPLVLLADQEYEHRKDYFGKRVEVTGRVSGLHIKRNLSGRVVGYSGRISSRSIEDGAEHHLKFHSDELSSTDIFPELVDSFRAYVRDRTFRKIKGISGKSLVLLDGPREDNSVTLSGLYCKDKGLIVDGRYDAQAVRGYR